MSTSSSPVSPRLPLQQIFAFGALGMPVAVMALIYGVYLPRHYVSLGVGQLKPGTPFTFLAVTMAFFAVRLLDTTFDPLCALVMDRFKTPIGRYRPWVLVGAPLAMIGVYQLLFPQHPVSVGYLIVWLVISFAGISLMTLGLAAWSAVLAKTYNDRSRLWAWTTPMGIVAVNLILLLPLYTDHKIAAGLKSSMPFLGAILLVAFPIALLITTVFSPEKVAPVVQRPKFAIADYRKAITRPAMWRLILADLFLALGPGTTGPLYVYYFHDAKGFTIPWVGFLLISYIGAGVLGAPFWGRVSRRFGKHRTVQIACVCYSVFQTILMALPRVWPHYRFVDAIPTIIGMFCVGFCASAFLLLVRSMIADVADEVRLERRKDLTSLIFSMVTTTTKIGGSITVLIVFPVLAFVHYNGKEGAVNTPGAIFGLEMCYLFAPIILVWFGGAMLFGYKLDARRHAEIRAALAGLDFAAAEESLTGPIIVPPDERTVAAA